MSDSVDRSVISPASSAKSTSFASFSASDTPLILVETAFFASAAGLFFLVNYYFPIGPIRLSFPIPIILAYVRWGFRSAWMTALVASLLLSILMGPTRSVFFVMPYALLGVSLGYFWQRSVHWSVALAVGAGIGTIGSLFRIWLVSVLVGEDLWRYLIVQTTGLIDWALAKLGFLPQPDAQLIQSLAIAIIVLSNVVYVFILHLTTWFLFERLGHAILPPPRWIRVILDLET
jgi:uncharacterized protein YybS (DUF2232 family)